MVKMKKTGMPIVSEAQEYVTKILNQSWQSWNWYDYSE